MSHLQHFATILAAAVALATVLSEPLGAERQVASRRAQGKAMANDLDVLTKLNDDYIQSVQHSNVKRFEEILREDFIESLDVRVLHRLDVVVVQLRQGFEIVCHWFS